MLRDGLEAKRERGQPLPLTEQAEAELEGEEVGIHWIQIELVGEDDEPIGGVRYQIELPGGKVRRGVLNDEGRARVDRIKNGGTCKVTFPDLDEEAWEKK